MLHGADAPCSVHEHSDFWTCTTTQEELLRVQTELSSLLESSIQISPSTPEGPADQLQHQIHHVVGNIHFIFVIIPGQLH